LSVSRRLLLAARVEIANCVCNRPRIVEPGSPRRVVLVDDSHGSPQSLAARRWSDWAA
jgi:hypothetical protein